MLSLGPAASAASISAPPHADASVDAGSVHVDRYGKGDAVVLLPGLTTGPWEWYDTIRHLMPNHTVYAVTLPGMDGRAPATAPLFDRVSSDLWAFLDAQKIARPVLVGHSIGGTLAILMGEQHPERLRGIVTLDGLPLLPGMERVAAEQRGAVAQQVAGQIAGETQQQLLDYEKGYMKTAGGVLDAGLADQAAQLEATSNPSAIAQWLREDLTGDLRPGLAKISVPLLVIAPYYAPDLTGAPVQYSEDEKVTYYRTLLNGAPRLQVVSISPARHFLMLDQPDKFYAILDAFLAQNR